MTSTIVVILVALNVVLLVLGLVAWRLFRSDPNPTVSDPLGVPRVARVSGIVGTLSDGSGHGHAGRAKSLVATTAGQAGLNDGAAPAAAPAAVNTTAPPAAAAPVSVGPDELDLPGLFAIDTGVPNSSIAATAD